MKKKNKILILVVVSLLLPGIAFIAVPYYLSRQILGEFVTVNEQLEKTNMQFGSKMQLSDSLKEKLSALNPELLKWYTESEELSTKTKKTLMDNLVQMQYDVIGSQKSIQVKLEEYIRSNK